MTCPYADSDAAYVLGALDPTERQAYRAHLVGCSSCRAAVDELAAMPGYLSRLLPGADAALTNSAAPDLVPRLAEQVRSERRFKRWRTAVVSLVVAAAAATAGVLVDVPPGADSDGTVLTMLAEPGVPVEATLLVSGRGWGTSIDTRCRYDGPSGGGGESPESTYLLFAIDENGAESLVSSWQQLAGREITIPGATQLDLSDIDRLEVRNGNGKTILQTSL